MMSREIGYSGEQQRRSIVLQYYVLIFEHNEAEPPQLRGPRPFARLVFMVTGHEIYAVPGRQTRQRRGMPRQVQYRAVDQIAGDGDEVCFQIVDSSHDALHETSLDGRPHVQVADLGDRKSMQR